MKRKWIIIAIMICMAAGVLFVPEREEAVHKVAHQHMIWPAESEKTQGFDENGVLTSHLPIVIIKTYGKEIPGSTPSERGKVTCKLKVINNDNGVNRSDDEPELKHKIAISIRGNSSRRFPKKQYGFKFVDESGSGEAVELLGMPKDTTWVLNGSYIDHSLIRNYMLYNISAEIMDYAPRCRLCEVMMEDEDGVRTYEGVYTLIEKVKVGENRLALDEYDSSYEETPFMLQMNSHIDTYKINHLKPDDISTYAYDLEYPDIYDLTKDSLDYIENEILEVEKAFYDADFTNDWSKVEEKIDIDTFVDYYLINEFFQNYDAGMRSTYSYKNLGGKFSIGPVWDFDGTFNNFSHKDLSVSYLGLKQTFYFYYLSQDPHFVEKCNIRYKELRDTVFSEKYLLDYIDDTSAYLGNAVSRNNDRWYGGHNTQYYDELEEMKEFVKKRGAWMDEYFQYASKVVN